jgi:hypothetical protein
MALFVKKLKTCVLELKRKPGLAEEVAAKTCYIHMKIFKIKFQIFTLGNNVANTCSKIIQRDISKTMFRIS